MKGKKTKSKPPAKPRDLRPSARRADAVKGGGLKTPTPGGPVPIPYPN